MLPSARVLWRIDAQETLWASVTRAVRTPSRIETDLRLTDYLQPSPDVYLQLAGSQDVRRGGCWWASRPAIAGSWRRRSTWTSPRSTIPTTAWPAFRRSRRRCSWRRFRTSSCRRRIRTASSATSDGFEISPDWRPALLGAPAAGATRCSPSTPGIVRASATASAPELYEGSVPRHQGLAQASLTLPKRVEVDYTHRAVGPPRGARRPRLRHRRRASRVDGRQRTDAGRRRAESLRAPPRRVLHERLSDPGRAAKRVRLRDMARGSPPRRRSWLACGRPAWRALPATAQRPRGIPGQGRLPVRLRPLRRMAGDCRRCRPTAPSCCACSATIPSAGCSTRRSRARW